jgi:hypothetical protein
MESGFACSKAPMTPAMLRWEIKGILCFYECAHCVCVCGGGEQGMACAFYSSYQNKNHTFTVCVLDYYFYIYMRP